MAWGSQFLRKDQWTKPLWERGPFKPGPISAPLELQTGEQGFVVQAMNLETLFTNAASTLFSHLTEKIAVKGIKHLDGKTVEVSGTTPTELLVNWLNVLLSLLSRQGMVCTEYDILEIDERHVEVEVEGEEYNARCHKLNMHIKRVLADKVRLQKANGLWHAVVVYET